MRILSRFFAAFAALLFALSAAHAQPVITAFIGTPTATSHVGYFVLDFDDVGANPETYAFGWNYEGTNTGEDFLFALQDALGGPNGFEQDGIYYDGLGYGLQKLGYNGRSKFNDFAGNDSGDPNGYWNLWLGFDGANWTNAQFGVSGVTLSDTPLFTGGELSGSSWQGWRWVREFSTDLPAPRTPTIAVAAPEPATVGYWALGIGCWVLSIVRRKRG